MEQISTEQSTQVTATRQIATDSTLTVQPSIKTTTTETIEPKESTTATTGNTATMIADVAMTTANTVTTTENTATTEDYATIGMENIVTHTEHAVTTIENPATTEDYATIGIDNIVTHTEHTVTTIENMTTTTGNTATTRENKATTAENRAITAENTATTRRNTATTSGNKATTRGNTATTADNTSTIKESPARTVENTATGAETTVTTAVNTAIPVENSVTIPKNTATNVANTEATPRGQTEGCTIRPFVTDVYPNVGPISGGTKITVIGQNLDIQGLTMLLADVPIKFTYSNESCIIASTPDVSSKVLTANTLTISTVSHGVCGESINTGFTFTYKTDPTINKIYPLSTIQEGGTTLTVEGASLDIVYEPALEINMLHTKINTGKVVANKTYISPCESRTANKMTCTTPAIEVPPVFIIDDTSQGSEDRDFILENGNDKLNFYIGFQLDGVDAFKNLSQTLPEYARIKVYLQPPEFEKWQDVMEIAKYKGIRLRINGKRLDRGLTASDYSIDVGPLPCLDVELTANEVSCTAPDQDMAQEEIIHEVTVHPGKNVEHFIGEYLAYLHHYGESLHLPH